MVSSVAVHRERVLSTPNAVPLALGLDLSQVWANHRRVRFVFPQALVVTDASRQKKEGFASVEVSNGACDLQGFSPSRQLVENLSARTEGAGAFVQL